MNQTKEQQKAIKAKRLEMIRENPKVIEWMKDPGKLRIINAIASLAVNE